MMAKVCVNTEGVYLYLSMRILCKHVLMRLATRGQLSLRTVSMPLQSILSCVSALEEKQRPA